MRGSRLPSTHEWRPAPREGVREIAHSADRPAVVGPSDETTGQVIVAFVILTGRTITPDSRAPRHQAFTDPRTGAPTILSA